jgi:hypothetical protein
MRKALAIALAGLAALTAARAPSALGQAGLDRRLAAATRIECSFSVLGTGTWDKNVPGPLPRDTRCDSYALLDRAHCPRRHWSLC